MTCRDVSLANGRCCQHDGTLMDCVHILLLLSRLRAFLTEAYGDSENRLVKAVMKCMGVAERSCSSVAP